MGEELDAAVIHEFIKSASAGKDGNVVNNKCMKKMMTDSQISKTIPQNEIDILLSKIMGPDGKKLGGLTIKQVQNEFCTEMGKKWAAKKKMSDDEGRTSIVNKIMSSSPKTHGATKAETSGATGRLTDTSKYTGAHKERFDASGKGKGKAGREDEVDNSGYVGNYKGEKTYDEKH